MSSSEKNETKNGCCACCRCVCFHYRDGFAITGQVLSILAWLSSWVFVGTFVVSTVAFVMQQCLWCCRQKPSAMKATIVLSGLAGLLEIGTGLFVTFVWKSRAERYDFDTDYVMYCEPFTFYYVVGNRSRDRCDETLYSIICFVSGFLWLASFASMLTFYCSGRYARLEEQGEKEVVAKVTPEKDVEQGKNRAGVHDNYVG